MKLEIIYAQVFAAAYTANVNLPTNVVDVDEIHDRAIRRALNAAAVAMESFQALRSTSVVEDEGLTDGATTPSASEEAGS